MTFYVRENKKINLYSINIDIYKLSILNQLLIHGMIKDF